MAHDPACIFCRIAAGEIPSKKVLEDDELIVFHDIAPWAPVHVLIVPKAHIATLYDIDASHTAMLGRMLALAPKLMRDLGVAIVEQLRKHRARHRRTATTADNAPGRPGSALAFHEDVDAADLQGRHGAL